MDGAVALPLPKFVQQSVKCVICSNYLSIAPVLYHDKGLICGRCAPKQQNAYPRATGYEILAQLFTFPCANSNRGCKEKLKWNSVLSHESTCQFQPLQCPVLPKGTCYWNGKKDELLLHFTGCHKELVLNESSYFYMPYKHDVEVNKLLLFNNSFLLFYMRNNIQTGKCWLALYSLDDIKNIATSYCVELKAAENSTSMILQKNIQHNTNASCSLDMDKMLSVDVNSIKAFLDSNNILCKIAVKSSTSKKQNENPESNVRKSDETVLKELECFICFEYMVPPIFLCTKGHSICGVCKEIKLITKCPMCDFDVTNIRNYALEKITAITSYPCKNKSLGCNYNCNSANIRQHESQCSVDVIECPLRCGWNGTIKSVLEHAQKIHNINTTWSLTDTLFRNLKSRTFVDFHLVKYDKKLFKVGIKHVSETGPVHWIVHEIGRQFSDTPIYTYTLKFIDQTNMGRQLVINNLCYGFGGANEFQNCLIMPYGLLKPFVTDEDQLIFQLKIQKI